MPWRMANATGRLSHQQNSSTHHSRVGLRASEFVQHIGYRNVAKGMRRLGEWLESGAGEEVCLQRVGWRRTTSRSSACLSSWRPGSSWVIDLHAADKPDFGGKPRDR